MPNRPTMFALGTIICFIASSLQAPIHAQAMDHPASRRPAAARQATNDWRTDIQQHARRMIDAGFFPGMAIAVTRGDKVSYVGSFGVADVNSGRGVDDRTRFYIASTTKALTATAVLLQASRGTLSLDAPITRYLPTLRFKAPLQARDVTIQSLLAMTDGIDSCLPVVFRTAFSGVFTQHGLIRLMQHCGPAKHGHAFAYRNLPYNILGMALAPGATNGWKHVVRHDVLAPLGMNETTARVSTLAPAQIAMPHQATGNGFTRIRLAKVDANLHAAGGYFTTARDLARFMAVQASDGMLDGKRIFPAQVMTSMHTQHARQNRDFGPYHRFGWGYGWDLGRYDGKLIVHRFGSFAGYRSHASFMPDKGIGVVVLVNGVAVPFAADAMADYIYDRLGRHPQQADARFDASFKRLQQRKARYAEHLRKHQQTVRARQQQPLSHPLGAYAGRYVNRRLGTMIWRDRDGRLDVSIGAARSQASIYDAARNQFRVQLTGRGEVVTFGFAKRDTAANSIRYNGYRFIRQHDQ
jgi:CubicO group peptidase (beta-lactamase class C family)